MDEFSRASLEALTTVTLKTIQDAREEGDIDEDLKSGLDDARIGLLRLLAVLKNFQFEKLKEIAR